MYKKNFMDGAIFAIFIALIGVSLIWFYGSFFLGALVNLPVSWFGFLYASAGMAAGMGCFVYIEKRIKALLVFAAIAFLAMILMLI